jgi:hypothetical protein
MTRLNVHAFRNNATVARVNQPEITTFELSGSKFQALPQRDNLEIPLPAGYSAKGAGIRGFTVQRSLGDSSFSGIILVSEYGTQASL